MTPATLSKKKKKNTERLQKCRNSRVVKISENPGIRKALESQVAATKEHSIQGTAIRIHEFNQILWNSYPHAKKRTSYQCSLDHPSTSVQGREKSLTGHPSKPESNRENVGESPKGRRRGAVKAKTGVLYRTRAISLFVLSTILTLSSKTSHPHGLPSTHLL